MLSLFHLVLLATSFDRPDRPSHKTSLFPTTNNDKKNDDQAPEMHESAANGGAINPDQTRKAYCEPGFRGLFTSYYVTFCAAFATMGGLLFGYDQGVISVILVEEQFLQRFGRIADGSAGSGFWKGLLTAMIELGALIGALNQGWIADRYSRKYSIVFAVGVFIVGSALQTGAMDYGMLVVARFMGEVERFSKGVRGVLTFHRRSWDWYAVHGLSDLRGGDLAS